MAITELRIPQARTGRTRRESVPAETLSWQFQDWITTWSALVKGRHPFLVALWANPVDGNAPVHDELRRVATREGIHFFTRMNHWDDWINCRETRPDTWLVEPGEALADQADDRVLVVDDDQYSCVVAGKMLELLGYRADFASNGAEAVNAFLPGKFSVILMDVTMPLIDGLNATKMIRRIETLAGGHVPIIAMTANVIPGDRERCLAAGMDEFLSKPFHKADLAEKLEIRSLFGGNPMSNHRENCKHCGGPVSEPKPVNSGPRKGQDQTICTKCGHINYVPAGSQAVANAFASGTS